MSHDAHVDIENPPFRNCETIIVNGNQSSYMYIKSRWTLHDVPVCVRAGKRLVMSNLLWLLSSELNKLWVCTFTVILIALRGF